MPDRAAIAHHLEWQGPAMKMLLGSLAAVVLLVAGSPAASQVTYRTGNNLYADCTTREDSPLYYQNDAACTLYVLGVNDAFAQAPDVASLLREEPANSTPEMLCVPIGVQAGQLRDVVLAYLRSNPATRHQSAAWLVLLALRAAYPCQ